MEIISFLATAGAFFFFIGFRVIYEYKRAVKFRFGKYVSIMQPGLRWIIPFVEKIQTVDIRIITINIPVQEIMTQDNVPVKINGVLFFQIKDTKSVILQVRDYVYAISQLSQASLRDVCGRFELDTILSKRDEIGSNIKQIVDEETENWGIKVTDVKIKDIELPENMKRSMAHQAEAERSRRAKIILADAEQQASAKLLEAGHVIDQSPAALKLRLYQTLTDIAAEKNSTILFPFPEEMINRFFKTEKILDPIVETDTPPKEEN